MEVEINVLTGYATKSRERSAIEAGANFLFDKSMYHVFLDRVVKQADKVIVVVDDDDDNLAANVMFLEDAGDTVHAFSNPLKLLEQIEEINPDAVLTDWDMPEMTGLMLVAKLREIFPLESSS